MSYQEKEYEVGAEKSFETLPEGTYGARVSGVIDLGTGKTKWFKTDPKTKEYVLDENGEKIPQYRREFSVNFEYYDGDKIGYASQQYGFSLGEDSGFFKLLKATGLAPEKGSKVRASTLAKALIGKKLMIETKNKTSATNGKVYPSVASAIPMMKGLELPELKNKAKDLFFDSFAEDVFKSLPQWMRDRIEISEEYRAMIRGNEADAKEQKLKDAINEPVTYTDEHGNEVTTAF